MSEDPDFEMEIVRSKESVAVDSTEEDQSTSEEREEETWIDGWEYISLEDLCQIGGGSTPSKSNSDYWEGGEILWTTPKDFDGPWMDNTEDKITEEGAEAASSSVYPENTTLVVVRSGVLRHTLPVAKARKRTTVNQDLKALQPYSDKVHPEYFFQAISGLSEDIRGSCKKTGTTVESIQTSLLRQYKLPVPRLSEQRNIASVLYTVDQAIQKTEAIIEQVKRVKRGLMQDFFHGRHRSHDEYKSTPVGEVPSHWTVTSIGSVVEMAQYGISESMSEEGGYPIFRMNNIENGYMIGKPMKYIDLDDDEFEKYRVEKQDILFNRTNSLELVGKTGIFEMEGDYVFASYLVRLRANDRVSPYYLNYYMNSYEGQNRMMDFATKGVSQANINANSIQQVKLPLPPKDEQKEIATQLRAVDREIEKNKAYVSQLRPMKKGLMQDLLTGEVRTADKAIEALDEVKAHG